MVSEWFGTVAAVDRALRTCIGSVELSVAPDAAETAIGRAPRVRENAFVSFASVTMPELERVVGLDADARELFLELVADAAKRDVLWLLYFRATTS